MNLPIIRLRTTTEKITEEQLSEIENFYKIKLPTDYRNFILKYNGGRPFPDTYYTSKFSRYDEVYLDEFYSISYEEFIKRCEINHFMDITPQNKKIKYIPIIAGGSGDDISICLSGLNKGKIYFFDSHCSDYDEEGFISKPKLSYLSKDFKTLMNSYIYTDEMEFEIRVINNDIQNVFELLKKGFNVNKKTEYESEKPLMKCIEYGKPKIAEILINNGAVITSNMLYWACNTDHCEFTFEQERLEILKLFIKCGASVNQSDGRKENLFMWSIGQSNYKAAEIIFNNGLDLDFKYNNNLKIIEYLSSVKEHKSKMPRFNDFCDLEEYIINKLK